MSDPRHDLELLANCEEELAGLRKACARLPRDIEALEEQARSARARIDLAEAELAEAEKARRTKEAEIEDSRAQRGKLEAQTAMVKTNEEYHALLREIDGAGARISQLEDEVLELMERIEDLGTRAAEVGKEQSAAEAELLGRAAGVRAELERAGARVDEVTGERELIIPRLGETIARQYQRVAARGGLPVAKILGTSCGGCHREVPPQLINQVQAGELHHCSYCLAILVPDPDADTP